MRSRSTGGDVGAGGVCRDRKLLVFVPLLALMTVLGGCSAMDEGYSAPESELSHSVATRDGGTGLELGEEYTEYSKTRHGPGPERADRASGAGAVLMYLPNRILDLIDIFRVDVGVGPTTGAVLRVTRFAQAGMRIVAPASARVGLFGSRELPFLLETSSEFGISPSWVPSKDRKVGDWELGAGFDFILIGAYFGIEVSEVVDFVLGIVGIDLEDDDF